MTRPGVSLPPAITDKLSRTFVPAYSSIILDTGDADAWHWQNSNPNNHEMI